MINKKSFTKIGICVVFLLVFTAFNGKSQGVKIKKIDETQSVEDTTIYRHAEIMPEFKGGNESLYRFLSDKLVYPKEARGVDNKGKKINDGMQGRVMVGFVIEADGSINNVEVQESSKHAILDEEALRVIKLMPKWEPGKSNGKPIRVQYVLPVVFKLN